MFTKYFFFSEFFKNVYPNLTMWNRRLEIEIMTFFRSNFVFFSNINNFFLLLNMKITELFSIIVLLPGTEYFHLSCWVDNSIWS